MSPLASAAAATSAGLTSAFAPGMTTMVLSALATVMIAVPVSALAASPTKHRAMPRGTTTTFSSWPNASLPRRPISTVGAPSFAAATAWFAPLPPGKYSTALPATVSPMRGCRSAVATTSMLMLPATKTRPMFYFQTSRLRYDRELLPDGVDLGQRRRSGFVAETLNLVGRSRAREIEMVVPAFAGVAEVRVDIGAVEHIAGAVGIEHAFARDRKGGKRVRGAGLVIPEQTALSQSNTADPA